MPKRLSNQLTDMQLRRWIAAGEPTTKTDGGGLTFTLSRAGTASWVLRYMRDGRARELTLGNYPDLSLTAARKLASEHRVSVDKGGDPAAEKRTERLKSRAAWTIRELAADYRAKALGAGGFSASTLQKRNWDLDNVIIPRLGPVRVDQITALEVVDMLEASGRGWAMQRQILTTAVQLFDHAIGRQIVKINPAAGVKLKALLGPKPAARKRVMLSDEELRTLLSSIDDIGKENALAFRILLATCVRGNELVKAKWEHIDFERATWYVPDDSVKTRAGFLIPLTPTVIEWFRELKTYAEDSSWVLPARRSGREGKHVGRTTLWAAFERAFSRDKIDIRHFTPHDTRSTAKGHMRNLGVSREISEIALNHKLKGMEGIYDVREEIPERRRALELWAAYLASLETPGSGKILPFSRQATV